MVLVLVELLKVIEPVLVDDVPKVSELAPVIVALPFKLIVEAVGWDRMDDARVLEPVK